MPDHTGVFHNGIRDTGRDNHVHKGNIHNNGVTEDIHNNNGVNDSGTERGDLDDLDDLGDTATVSVRRAFLAELSARLAPFTRELVTDGTGTPRLVVTNPYIPSLTETVTCARDHHGTLAYFWAWGEPITHAGDDTTAALRITAVLDPGRHQ